MKCPYCISTESKVVDKRNAQDSVSIRRRRECLKCTARYTTYEQINQPEIYIVKKDQIREPFNKEKLTKGIIIACQKRPISQQSIEKVINEIETTLRKRKKKEVNSRILGEIIMRKLKKLDKVAYIRFASVYRDFQDLETFEEELQSLK